MPRILRWTLASCVLLLALVWPAAVHAYGPASAADSGVSMDSGAAPPLRHLDRCPADDHSTQSPVDSDEVWFDEEDDDDDDDRECSGATALGHILHSAFTDVLGLRPSRAPMDLLSPDGSTLAPRFLTESVRRI